MAFVSEFKLDLIVMEERRLKLIVSDVLESKFLVDLFT